MVTPRPIGRGRKIVVSLVALVVVLGAGFAVALVVVRGRPLTARDLVPSDALLVVSVKAPADPLWDGVITLLRNFPGAEQLSRETLATSFERFQRQTLPNGVPPLPLSVFRGDSLLALMPTGRSQPSPAAGNTRPDVDILVVVGVEGEQSLAIFLESVAAHGVLQRASAYRGIPVWQGTSRLSATRPVLLASVQSFVVASTSTDVLHGVVDHIVGRGRGGRPAGLADAEAFQKVTERLNISSSVQWAVAPDAVRLARLVQAAGTLPLPVARVALSFGFAVSAERDAFHIRSIMVGGDARHRAAFPLTGGLVQKLPEKLLGQWVSYLSEQRDPAGTLRAAGVADRLRQPVQDLFAAAGIHRDVLTFGFEQLLPALHGQTAVIVAPFTDGKSPVMALVAEVDAARAEALGRGVDQLFSGLARAVAPGAAELQEGHAAGARVQTFRALTPELRTALGVRELAVAFPLGYLVLATHAEAAAEIVHALGRVASVPTLAQNDLVREQLNGRPSDVLDFTYTFPGGLPGLLYGFLCDRFSDTCAQASFPQPTVQAALDAATMVLRVPRTIGGHTILTDDSEESEVRVRITPLTPAERSTYDAAVAVLKGLKGVFPTRSLTLPAPLPAAPGAH